MARSVFSDFAAALASGGDGRLAVDPGTGLNKYLCPPRPAADVICASSCTASPISQSGFERARAVFDGLAGASSARAERMLLQQQAVRIERDLLRYFKAERLAKAILCPSGTDALLTATRLLAAERPGVPMTAILPSASETGTGVPLAAAGRLFNGPCQGLSTTQSDIGTCEITLRAADGVPLPAEEIDAAYAAAVSSAPGRPVVYLTHGTKTGLIAPHEPPANAEVIVDACQTRIDPARVEGYLRLGWPVVVTGSKFFGGPAFSGAVLLPGRQSIRRAPGLGTLLRWTAALDAMDRFALFEPDAASFLHQRVTAIQNEIAGNSALVPIGGLESDGEHWADQPSIVTFAIRDTAGNGRLLSVKALRPIHERLARDGILLGQPVSFGAFGGLRIAIGARDVIEPSAAGFVRLLCAIKAIGREGAVYSHILAIAAE